MTIISTDPNRFVENIRKSGLTIYHPIPVGHPDLWIPTPELEALLDAGLRGLSLEGLALRTRSKVIKENVCRVLGYPIPTSFKKTQPRFIGQMFDTYGQLNNNLQVWNEELSATRRYVLVRILADATVSKVKVVTGDSLAKLDRTGTLTSKYQARCIPASSSVELISGMDTTILANLVCPDVGIGSLGSPAAQPKVGDLASIKTIFDKLSPLVGQTFADAGIDQERNRGAALHKLICIALGYPHYHDDGQFPDVRHQLLEVKLQTSQTVDLGLVTPDSTEPLDVPMLNGRQIRHCDVRYAIFYASLERGQVRLTHFFLSTGEKFFTRFPQFQGRRINAKLQIPLSADFFT